MNHPESWPALLHPLVPSDTAPGELVPDTTRTVEAHQLRPDLVAALAQWAAGTVELRDSGPVVVLPDDRGTVELGGYAVRDPWGVHTEVADGFWQRWWPADTAGTP